MQIFPAIDIIDGKCVRLTMGDYQQKDVYADFPHEVARQWVLAGATYLHVVDLDGARAGHPVNLAVIERIRQNSVTSEVPIQLGGGIRTMEHLEQALACGATRVILGTSAISDQVFLKQALNRYPEHVVVGVDVKDGMVAVSGWYEQSGIAPLTFVDSLEQMGVTTIVYTDIARDGTLSGPNIAGIKQMVAQSSIEVIAAGGMSVLEDVRAVKETGAAGVVIGKALYTGGISLKEALVI